MLAASMHIFTCCYALNRAMPSNAHLQGVVMVQKHHSDPEQWMQELGFTDLKLVGAVDDSCGMSGVEGWVHAGSSLAVVLASCKCNGTA
jgi:uncharacterized membrane protein